MAVVAVLPFENLTDYPNAGEIVADLVATEFYAVERFKVIVAQTALKMFQDAGGVPAPAADRVYAREVGQRISADAVIYGSVQEFAYRLDKTRLGPREPAVAITLRMVDVGTGATLWAASESRSSDALFSQDRDPVNRVAQAVARHFRKLFEERLKEEVK